MAADFMPLHGVHHVELYVGNALQAAHYFEHAFGFRRIAFRGLETGERDSTSHVLVQGRIRLVVTGALGSDSPIAAHHRRHGDGVKVIALSVPDARRAHAEAVARGATSVSEPRQQSDDHGRVWVAAIEAYGETVHALVEHGDYAGAFLPGFAPAAPSAPPGDDDPMLLAIDHIVGNVELGTMDRWVRFYEDVFGMTEMVHFTDQQIATEYSALMSKVMADGRGLVKFPINEPAVGRRRSQIDEYLEYYEGPGAQHVALATRDIAAAVVQLRRRGVEFLAVPSSYYDGVVERVPEVADQLAQLRDQSILVDRDEEGYLLQVFTKPIGDRPTLFFELIERRGARGFGNGNFKALFEAIEREQARRGNL